MSVEHGWHLTLSKWMCELAILKEANEVFRTILKTNAWNKLFFQRNTFLYGCFKEKRSAQSLRRYKPFAMCNCAWIAIIELRPLDDQPEKCNDILRWNWINCVNALRSLFSTRKSAMETWSKTARDGLLIRAEWVGCQCWRWI